MTQNPPKRIHLVSYTFRQKDDVRALRILEMLRDPSKVDSDAVRDGILNSKNGGFSYRLGEFLDNRGLVKNSSPKYSSDVVAIAQHCTINESEDQAHLLIDGRAVNALSPKALDRFQDNIQFKKMGISIKNYTSIESVPKNMLVPD